MASNPDFHTEPQRKYSFLAEMLKYASEQWTVAIQEGNRLAQLKSNVTLIAVEHMQGLFTNIIDQTEHGTVPFHSMQRRKKHIYSMRMT